jgi:hypothetical protein
VADAQVRRQRLVRPVDQQDPHETAHRSEVPNNNVELSVELQLGGGANWAKNRGIDRRHSRLRNTESGHRMRGMAEREGA